MGEIKLNDISDLNPDLTKLAEDKTPSSHVLQKRKDFINTYYPQLNKEDKKKVIEDWNEKPEVKENGIKAIDKKSYKWLKILAIVGIVALLIIIFSGAIFSYLALNDGTLLNPVSQICGSVNVTASCPSVNVSCSQIPDITCPDTTCGDCNPPDIKIYCGNSTI